jgi:recombination protein RecT
MSAPSKINAMKQQVQNDFSNNKPTQIQTQLSQLPQKKEVTLLDALQDSVIKQLGQRWNSQDISYATNLIQTAYVKAKSNTKLMNAINTNRESFLNCISKAINLKLGGAARDLFYLIPYEIKGQLSVQFQISYMGIMELAYRSGLAKLFVREVYECDTFVCKFGFDQVLEHEPNFEERPNSKIIRYYAVVKSKDCDPICEVMSVNEINDHMKKYSKSYNRSDSAWITDFDAMAKKTVLLKALKWVKKSPELEEQFYNDLPDNYNQNEEPKLINDNFENVIDVEENNIKEKKTLINDTSKEFSSNFNDSIKNQLTTIINDLTSKVKMDEPTKKNFKTDIFIETKNQFINLKLESLIDLDIKKIMNDLIQNKYDFWNDTEKETEVL